MTQKDAADDFVHELPLVVTPADEVVLDKRFRAARALYDACLHEALKRLRRVRDSAEWKAAREIPRGKGNSSCRRDTPAASGGPSGSHGRRIAETEARIASLRAT